MSFVRQLVRSNPRIGYRQAARQYFRRHPEKLAGTKLESAARRVSDKARREEGLAPGAAHLDELKLLQLRFVMLAGDLDRIVSKLEGQLPAAFLSGFDTQQIERSVITSMELTLELIRRARLALPDEE